MTFTRIENFDLFYEVRGVGEPLILLSGFASGAWIWYRQIEDLAKDFRVIAFDPRGVGNSKISDETPVSIKNIADDTARLLKAIGVMRANILGASFGGFVAQEFALRYPEKLNRLILACTSFGGAHHVAPNSEVLATFTPLPSATPSERVRKFMLPAFTREFAENEAEEIEKVCALREAHEVPETVYLQQLAAATSFDTESRLIDLQAETLILTGDCDLVVPPENSVNLARVIPHSQLKIIEGGSHLFFIEKAEKFNNLVRDFLQR